MFKVTSSVLLSPFQWLRLFRKESALIWQLAKREILEEVRGSALGLLWTVLNPLLMLTVYAVVFGMIFGARFDQSPNPGRADYVLGLFLGLALYRLVADVLTGAPRLLVSRANFVKKVVFPLEALPVTLLYVGVFRFLITFSLLAVGILIFRDGVAWHVLWLPVCIAPTMLIALGLGYLLSALGVFFRDLAHITGILSTVVLYASGVFYAAAKVESMAPEIWLWLQWNPLLITIEASRKVLLWNAPPDFASLGYAWAFGLLLCSLAYAIFRRLRPAFADVL